VGGRVSLSAISAQVKLGQGRNDAVLNVASDSIRVKSYCCRESVGVDGSERVKAKVKV